MVQFILGRLTVLASWVFCQQGEAATIFFNFFSGTSSVYGWNAVASAGQHAGSSYYCTWQGTTLTLSWNSSSSRTEQRSCFWRGKAANTAQHYWNEEDLTHLHLGSVCFGPVLRHWEQTIKPVAKEVLPAVQGRPNGCTASGCAHCPRVLPPFSLACKGRKSHTVNPPWLTPKPWCNVLAFYCTSPFPKLSLEDPLFSCWLLMFKPTII